MISYVNIHSMNNPAQPEAIMKYKLSLQLFKLYNTAEYSLEWTSQNFNQILTSRQRTFSITKTNDRKVGLNLFSNMLSALNGTISLELLNNSKDWFKVKCKRLYLMWT